MKDVGIWYFRMTVKLVKCYFLAYLHLGDINFNKKKEDEERCNLIFNNWCKFHVYQLWARVVAYVQVYRQKFDVVDVNLVWKHQQKTFLSNFSVQNASDSLFVGPC